MPQIAEADIIFDTLDSEITDLPIPEVGPNDVLVKIAACGSRITGLSD